MLVSRLGEQEVCGDNRDKIRGIKKKELQRFIELGNDLQMESKKLFNKKCNFYNRGFCSKGNQCVFLHPLRLCRSILEGNICEDAQCEDRHPFECRKYRTKRGCSWGSKCEFLHTDADNIDNERESDNRGDVVTDLELEIGRGGFGFDILEKDSRVEAHKEPLEVGNSEVIDEREMSIMHREGLEDESDGFLLLEKAIADGKELDNDLLDKILESMEKGEEPKEEKKAKEKKVKENKVKEKKVKEKKVKKASGKACKKHLTD